MAKLVYIIVDGMGDLPINALNHKTPLEYAYKPNISLLLSHAAYGYPSVLGKLAPQSDAGVLADLGYDPVKYSTGRGWFECLGLGMQPKDGELSLRVNFGQVAGGNLVSVRTFLSADELKILEEEINSKVAMPVSFRFKSGEGYRGGLILAPAKKALSQYVSNNEPGYKVKFYKNGSKLSFATGVKIKKVEKIKAIRKEATYTANLLNLFIRKAIEVIKKSEVYKKRLNNKLPPPNYLFLRDAAVKDPALPDITKNFGKSWGAVVGMPLEKGIAMASGMRVISVQEKADLQEDLNNKGERTLSAMKMFDCVYLHIKQADSAAHLGKYSEKYAIIEAIDKFVISKLSRALDVRAGDTLVLTCDHSTSSELKRHINSNIPVLIINKKFGQNRDFGEAGCKANHLSELKKATDIMSFVMRLL
jgi:2,3-bisphosphoglycerate-independent phosphoglycerate mutase